MAKTAYNSKKNKKEKQFLPFVLTQEEQQKIQSIRPEVEPKIEENGNSIWIYVEEMFKWFETRDFSEISKKGLVDRYDYMTIQRAKYFTIVAIVHLLLDVKKGNKSKDMFSLLEVIRDVSIDYYNFPHCDGMLGELEKKFTYYLAECEDKDRKIWESRKISWKVVKKYALLYAGKIRYYEFPFK